jgi:hypothetical protein
MSTSSRVWLAGRFPAAKDARRPRTNLPVQLTSFIGRENQIADVKDLLAAARLLTLTGVGGTGKTRLALQVAADELDTFTDGVWLVELAPLSDPGLVPQSVATALDVPEEMGRPRLATLTDALRARQLLLLLDNCEHVVEVCAQLAEGLLRACPKLKVLATSREALRIAPERPIGCLPLPFRRVSTTRRGLLSTKPFACSSTVPSSSPPTLR